ncbi:guanine methyltransferase Trm5 [Polyplosphaeria fusca]|uniref:tRNA (guanine(37)-N1)-methyltransferase n=1 Tax=Polyplosphaeria fusca TaxID=682080 RepID=A0A9P4V780_9PLEO|nr:guanine methyltransferase Trm5 [Polyplosphaeria fusca]
MSATSDMFAPPVNRAMKVLDRSFFQKTVPISAARIFSPRDISRCRKELESSKDLPSLNLSRAMLVRPDPDATRAQSGGKCILLKPEILHNDITTWSPGLRHLESSGALGVIPYSLSLDYSSYTYADIMNAIIEPSDEPDELPTGFAQAGHVAHLNLRSKYLPHKHLIATVLADKNPHVRTVIHKLDDVGAENAFRTFKYEVLHGPDDMAVTLNEQGCTFSFDFSRVYWNSRLHTEHERMARGVFASGDAICDVMAGIGPFAVPAGKKKCFVYANDLNPDSFRYLNDAIRINKVGDYVRSFNDDGHAFIRTATADLLQSRYKVDIMPKTKPPRNRSKSRAPVVAPLKTLVQPRIFAHYVMNLPASAITFLPNFVGLYSNVPGVSRDEIRELLGKHGYPMIHVYCFSTKSDDNVAETKEICDEISRQLKCEITPETPELVVYDVRDVAPKKRMFCASFRLPEEVAFREV